MNNAHALALQHAADKRRHEIEAALIAFAASLEAIRTQWVDSIHALLNRRDLQNASPRNLLSVYEAQIPAALTRHGFPRVVTDATAPYPSSLAAIAEQQQAVGDVPAPVSREVQDAVLALQTIDQHRLARLGETVAFSLAAALVTSRIVGATAQELTETTDRLSADLAKAVPVVTVGRFASDRIVARHVWSKVADTFLFYGPKDERNSPFCATHVGKAFTVDKIDKMNNGQNSRYNDVWTWGGHVGCRHVWIPVL